MATKRDRERFAKRIRELLTDCGARPGDGMYEWEFTTPHGLILFSVVESSGNDLAWIAGRFDNVESGKAFGANPYSGKWNHHYFGANVQTAIDDFAWQLRRVGLTYSNPVCV